MQFWPPDDEHMCSEHVKAWNKTYRKTKILCIKLVNYWDKYTEMHGMQNIEISNGHVHKGVFPEICSLFSGSDFSIMIDPYLSSLAPVTYPLSHKI